VEIFEIYEINEILLGVAIQAAAGNRLPLRRRLVAYDRFEF